jgi:hypothetical protein
VDGARARFRFGFGLRFRFRFGLWFRFRFRLWFGLGLWFGFGFGLGLWFRFRFWLWLWLWFGLGLWFRFWFGFRSAASRSGTRQYVTGFAWIGFENAHHGLLDGGFGRSVRHINLEVAEPTVDRDAPRPMILVRLFVVADLVPAVDNHLVCHDTPSPRLTSLSPPSRAQPIVV